MEDIREAEETRQMQEIEKKHLQGLLTREEAILARQNLLLANKNKRIRFEEDVSLSMFIFFFYSCLNYVSIVNYFRIFFITFNDVQVMGTLYLYNISIINTAETHNSHRLASVYNL